MKDDPTWPAFDRRRGPRRTHEETSEGGERRQDDRRKNTPGLSALWRAIVGNRREPDDQQPGK